MSIEGIILDNRSLNCEYIDGMKSISETFLIRSIEEGDFEVLLSLGYRHFGSYFFRPMCGNCHKCIPLRIPLNDYKFPKSGRRLLSANRNLDLEFGKAEPSREAYNLYLLHKKRFGDSSECSYDEYINSFHYPFQFAYCLKVKDGDKLIAVAHLDLAGNSLSAVYCYFDDSYRRESLGTFAVYKEIEIALERGIDYMYLGYYIAENDHMNYKCRFRPNQLLVKEQMWIDYTDSDNNITADWIVDHGFVPEFHIGELLKY